MATTAYPLELGPLTMPCACKPSTQPWLDRALNHIFGFNHEEASRVCERALRDDPDCAMAHFYLAYCNAPNYNNPGGLDIAAGREHLQRAKALFTDKTPALERELITAQEIRYPADPAQDPADKAIETAYADAMRTIYSSRKDDAHIAAFFAEALMNIYPWALWVADKEDPSKLVPAASVTVELVEVLETALDKVPSHCGLCHYYVHTMELGPCPGKALPAANQLRRGVSPDSGHLIHMASHIDVWVGDYASAITANIKAVHADQQYMEFTKQDNEFYKMYRMHNFHFGIWACMLDGQSAKAMQLVDQMDQQLQDDAMDFSVGDLPFGHLYLDAFKATRYHAMIRFGLWSRILGEALRDDEERYAATMAAARYARGIAYAATGKVAEAQAERAEFIKLKNGAAMKDRVMMNNPMVGADGAVGVLDIATSMLDGEIAYRQGEFKRAFECLRDAVAKDDALLYDEPWGWMMPARHPLGALLTEQGHLEEAEAVFRADLKKYPDNIFGLKGLHDTLAKQTGRDADLAEVKAKLEAASPRSDIDVFSACFCAGLDIACCKS